MTKSTVTMIFIGSLVAIAGGVVLLTAGLMFVHLVAGPVGTRDSATQTDPLGATA